MSEVFSSVLPYLFARVFSYSMIGLVAGIAGRLVFSDSQNLTLKIGLSILLFAFVFLHIFKIAGDVKSETASAISNPSAALKSSPRNRSAERRLFLLFDMLAQLDLPRGVVLGLLTPFIPCGLFWSAVLLAMQAPGALHSMFFMAVFALASSPALWGGQSVAEALRRISGRFWKYLSPLFLLVALAMGLWRLWMPMAAHDHATVPQQDSNTEVPASHENLGHENMSHENMIDDQEHDPSH